MRDPDHPPRAGLGHAPVVERGPNAGATAGGAVVVLDSCIGPTHSLLQVPKISLG